MPLCEIVGFTCTGKTFNIAYAMITHENTDMYEWVLRCLRCLFRGALPSVIVTDRELGLINALPRVFPTVNHQLCWVHVERKCGEAALELGKSLEYQARFKADCWSLFSSRSEDIYQRRRRAMHAAWDQLVPGLMAYLETTWLVSYAPNIVRAWTDTTLHFGTRTTNRCAYSVPSPEVETIDKFGIPIIDLS